MAEVEQSAVVKPDTDLTDERPSDLREQVAVLKERLEGVSHENEMLKGERERERRQLEEQIEMLRTSLEKAQQQHGKAMLLLTHQSEEGGGMRKVAALEDTVTQLKQQNKRIYRALKEQQAAAENRGFWKRLFG
jgi:DNA repair exonuclease SbcCD ATPase subunit